MLGEALAHMGAREEGSKLIAESIGYYETLGKEVNGLNERRELIISQQQGADIRLMNGDAAGALAIYQRAQSALEVMAKPDPENAMLRIDLANMNYYRGRALTVLGRNGEASRSLQRALADFEKTRDAAEASGEYPRGPAAIYIWLGDLSVHQSNLSLALQHFQRTITLLESPARCPGRPYQTAWPQLSYSNQPHPSSSLTRVWLRAIPELSECRASAQPRRGAYRDG